MVGLIGGSQLGSAKKPLGVPQKVASAGGGLLVQGGIGSFAYANSSPGPGWVLCEGNPVLAEDYPALAALYGSYPFWPQTGPSYYATRYTAAGGTLTALLFNNTRSNFASDQNGTFWFACLDASGNLCINRSTDNGLTWTLINVSAAMGMGAAAGTAAIYCPIWITYGAGRLVMDSAYAATGIRYSVTSTDGGTTWNVYDSVRAYTACGVGPDGKVYGLVNQTYLYINKTATAAVLASANQNSYGQPWGGNALQPHSIAFHPTNGRVLVLDNGSPKTGSSTDCVRAYPDNVSVVTGIGLGYSNAIVWAGDRFFHFGDLSGNIAYSFDGLTWSKLPTPYVEYFYGLINPANASTQYIQPFSYGYQITGMYYDSDDDCFVFGTGFGAGLYACDRATLTKWWRFAGSFNYAAAGGSLLNPQDRPYSLAENSYLSNYTWTPVPGKRNKPAVLIPNTVSTYQYILTCQNKCVALPTSHLRTSGKGQLLYVRAA